VVSLVPPKHRSGRNDTAVLRRSQALRIAAALGILTVGEYQEVWFRERFQREGNGLHLKRGGSRQNAERDDPIAKQAREEHP